MVSLIRLNKVEIGKLLIPNKIYNFKYKFELEKLYQKLYFDNLNYLVILNLFFGSIIFNLIIYILIFPQINSLFENYMTSYVYKYLILVFTWFLTNLISYYIFLFAYFFYNDSKFKKGELEIENYLPEFIDNLVSNLKGGIAIEKALVKSVRQDQVALFKEVSLIDEKIFMGKSVQSALFEFSNRFDSPIIKRTFFLIQEGMKGGGNLAKPLERISENLKKIYELMAEVKANSGGFAIIIKAISIVVAPILFALAITLLSFIGDLFKLISKGKNSFLSVSAIPPEYSIYLTNFSYAMIILITVFSSLITSQIKNEKIYTALKYIPFYVIISLFLFNIFTKTLLSVFSGIMG